MTTIPQAEGAAPGCARCHGSKVVLVPDLAAYIYGGRRLVESECPDCAPAKVYAIQWLPEIKQFVNVFWREKNPV